MASLGTLGTRRSKIPGGPRPASVGCAVDIDAAFICGRIGYDPVGEGAMKLAEGKDMVLRLIFGRAA